MITDYTLYYSILILLFVLYLFCLFSCWFLASVISSRRRRPPTTGFLGPVIPEGGRPPLPLWRRRRPARISAVLVPVGGKMRVLSEASRARLIREGIEPNPGPEATTRRGRCTRKAARKNGRDRVARERELERRAEESPAERAADLHCATRPSRSRHAGRSLLRASDLASVDWMSAAPECTPTQAIKLFVALCTEAAVRPCVIAADGLRLSQPSQVDIAFVRGASWDRVPAASPLRELVHPAACMLPSGGRSRRQAQCLRVLLLLAGIEPNPGPTAEGLRTPRGIEERREDANDAAERATAFVESAEEEAEEESVVGSSFAEEDSFESASQHVSGGGLPPASHSPHAASRTHSEDHHLGVAGGKPVRPRGTKRAILIGRSLSESLSQIRGAADAAEERAAEAAEQFVGPVDHAKPPSVGQHAMEAGANCKWVNVDDEGFCLLFHGAFSASPTFCQSDPQVSCTYHRDGQVIVSGVPGANEVWISPSVFSMACRIGASMDHATRMRNVAVSLTTSEAQRALDEQHPQSISHVQLRAFILVGCTTAVENIAFLPKAEATLVMGYPVPLDPEARDRVAGHLRFHKDIFGYTAKQFRSCRLAPYTMQGFYPLIPANSDPDTMAAGVAKRILPGELPMTSKMRGRLVVAVDQLISLCLAEARANPRGDQADYAERLEHFLDGRPSAERRMIQDGIDAWESDPTQAISTYMAQDYKCFVKAETYRTPKPPRLIMSLTPEQRGMQFSAMSQVLSIVEAATAPGNVKHLSPQMIYDKLVTKFSHVQQCFETDFSSFESCISPAVKELIESRVFKELFRELGLVDAARWYKAAVEDRHTLNVHGPHFDLIRIPHIRMSGDLWTSIGNLIVNVCVVAACTKVPVSKLLEDGLFEGDDGIFPCYKLKDKTLERRAAGCGMRLKFLRGAWDELSFCGNFHEFVDGSVCRARDPVSVMSGLTCLFRNDGGPSSVDRMLQRSKCLSVLTAPWVKVASVFAACVERLTRDVRVDETRLRLLGLLKNPEYSCYGLEKCIPSYCTLLLDASWLEQVYRRENSAGGPMTRGQIWHMYHELKCSHECNSYHLPAQGDVFFHRLTPDPDCPPRDSLYHHADRAVEGERRHLSYSGMLLPGWKSILSKIFLFLLSLFAVWLVCVSVRESLTAVRGPRSSACYWEVGNYPSDGDCSDCLSPLEQIPTANSFGSGNVQRLVPPFKYIPTANFFGRSDVQRLVCWLTARLSSVRRCMYDVQRLMSASLPKWGDFCQFGWCPWARARLH